MTDIHLLDTVAAYGISLGEWGFKKTTSERKMLTPFCLTQRFPVWAPGTTPQTVHTFTPDQEPGGSKNVDCLEEGLDGANTWPVCGSRIGKHCRKMSANAIN